MNLHNVQNHLAVLTATLLIVVLAGGPVAAQTADGSTPAEETVCDSEVGKASGLCTSYCEAMDCDSDTPSASEKACTKVSNNYQELTGTPPPCESQQPPPPTTATCPCDTFAKADIASLALLTLEFESYYEQCGRVAIPHA